MIAKAQSLTYGVLVVFSIALSIGLTTSAFAKDEQRFVSASSLNVHSAPQMSASVVGALQINARVSLLQKFAVSECNGDAQDCGPPGGWCLVEERLPQPGELETATERRSEKALRGYVACSYLSFVPAYLSNLDRELARLIGEKGEKLQSLASPQRAKAFDILERMFALSPTPDHAHRYRELLDAAYPGWASKDGAKSPEPDRAKRVATYEAMQKRLPGVQEDEKVTRLMGKPGSSYYSQSIGSEATKKSLFRQHLDVVGWAGYAEASRISQNSYALQIAGESHVAPLYHIARAMGIQPNVKTYHLQDREAFDGPPELDAVSIDGPIKAYAITPKGLYEATVLTLSSQAPTNCTSVPSSVEFRLTVTDNDVFGLFITPKAFDISHAKVTKTEQHYRADSSTLTDVTLYSIDLNGDGIADIRGGQKFDREIDGNEPTPKGYTQKISYLDLQRIALAVPSPWRMIKAAGWYGNDSTWIEANISGIWYLLSSYSPSSCT